MKFFMIFMKFSKFIINWFLLLFVEFSNIFQVCPDDFYKSHKFMISFASFFYFFAII